MVSAHGIQGYMHNSLLLYFSIKRIYGPSLVSTAVAAETMWLLRLSALTAF
jgi:hypothetical protein